MGKIKPNLAKVLRGKISPHLYSGMVTFSTLEPYKYERGAKSYPFAKSISSKSSLLSNASGLNKSISFLALFLLFH